MSANNSFGEIRIKIEELETSNEKLNALRYLDRVEDLYKIALDKNPELKKEREKMEAHQRAKLEEAKKIDEEAKKELEKSKIKEPKVDI